MSQPKRKKGPMNRARPAQSNSKIGNDYQEQCLRNSLVLRTIFSSLSTSDLFICRQVNKCWYTEVNSVMMNLDIALKISSDQPVQHVGQLIQLIPEMSLPFNGLSFRNDVVFPSKEREIPEDANDLIVPQFLQILPPIKHLKIDNSLASEHLIAQILRANAGHLESLSFDNNSNLPFKIMVAIYGLEKLKSLIPRNSSGLGRSSWDVNLIVRGLESLESVNDYTFQDLWVVPENRFHVVKNFSFNPFYLYPHIQERAFKFVETKPRLKSLTCISNSLDFSPPVTSILSQLVYSSKTTLTSVDFSPYIWGLLARGHLHFEPLPRIRELYKVPVNLSRMTSDQISNFGSFIAYTFPNLKYIEVENLDFDEEGADGNYDDVFVNPNDNCPLTNSSVTSLKFVECRPLQVSLSPVILVAFPNVTNLNVSLREGKLQSMYDLWGEGPDLQSLTISAQAKSRLEMESELLGIFPQEVRRLRKLKLSPVQLKSLQIVPIRPALHYLPGLVELNIKIRLGRSGILLLQWNGQEARCASDFDHNEIIKTLSLERMRSLKIAG